MGILSELAFPRHMIDWDGLNVKPETMDIFECAISWT